MNSYAEALTLGADLCSPLDDIPFLGVGLGFREALKSATLEHLDRIDFLELMTEHYIEMPPHKTRELELLAAEIPLVMHGVELSIGTFDWLDVEYLEKMRRVAELAHPHWISDHLCMTRVPERAIGNLTPVPLSPLNCSNIAHNARRAAEFFDCPFLLENISYYFQPPPTEMTEEAFVTRVLEGADCHMLLDLTNLCNNAINMGYNAYRYLDGIPLDRVVQIHLAGGYYHGSLLLDTHSHRVPDPVLDLLKHVLPRLPNLRGVLIERDQNFPPFTELLDELDGVRELVRQHWTARRAVQRLKTPQWLS